MNWLTDLFRRWFHPTPPPPVPVPPMPIPEPNPLPDDGSFATQLLTLHNQHRQTRDRLPLAVDHRLAALAQAHSQLQANRRRMGHDPNLGGRVRDGGYPYLAIGENVAFGQTTPTQVFQGWSRRPGHAANILRPGYRDVGFGSADGPDGRRYWTAIYGTPVGAQTPSFGSMPDDGPIVMLGDPDLAGLEERP